MQNNIIEILRNIVDKILKFLYKISDYTLVIALVIFIFYIIFIAIYAGGNIL